MEISQKGKMLLVEYPKILVFFVVIWILGTSLAVFFSPWFLLVAFLAAGVITFFAYALGVGGIMLRYSDLWEETIQ